MRTATRMSYEQLWQEYTELVSTMPTQTMTLCMKHNTEDLDINAIHAFVQACQYFDIKDFQKIPLLDLLAMQLVFAEWGLPHVKEEPSLDLMYLQLMVAGRHIITNPPEDRSEFIYAMGTIKDSLMRLLSDGIIEEYDITNTPLH